MVKKAEIPDHVIDAAMALTAERGWVDRRQAALEILTGIRRAGADIIITYWAYDAARWLAE